MYCLPYGYKPVTRLRWRISGGRGFEYAVGNLLIACLQTSSSLAPGINHHHLLKMQTTEKSFVCYHCNRQFSSKSNLSRHMQIHNGEKEHICGQCNKIFAHKSHLTGHMKIHNGEKQCLCVQCNKQFALKQHLTRHMKIHTDEKQYLCLQCNEQFALKQHLTRHMKIHNGEKQYLCVQCNEQFALKQDLTRHMKIHTGEKQYLCVQCKEQFALKQDLTRHMKIHTGEKQYLCVQCKEQFALKQDLTRHMKIHTGEKHYICVQCKEQFALKQDLTRHMKIHTGEKQYLCVQCKEQFALKQDLTRHMKIHTGEKQYLCVQCNEQFALKQHLTRHMKIHTGEKHYICVQCNEQFALKQHLSSHMKIHTGEKQYICAQCNQQFALQSALTRHMNIHSGSKESDLENFEFSPESALKKFYDSSSQYRPLLNDYPSLVGHPLTLDETSASINAYNDKLNANLSMWGCAVCGIRELSGEQHTLPLSELSSLILTEDDLSRFQNISPEFRCCFNIIVLEILGIRKGFYLHADFIQSNRCQGDSEHLELSDKACLCTACYQRLHCKNPTVPKFSIAAGYDFGHPLKGKLKPLTIIERKLISRNIVFATIIKLVASNGKNIHQHGLQGHIIAMPHQGAQVAAAAVALPNVDSVTDMMSVMFVGSAEQWRSAAGKSGEQQRANFILAHNSIFQVRSDVVFSWLFALKSVGNPFYSDVNIMERTPQVCSNMEKIPDKLINEAHVASDEITIVTEQFTVSDVANVRPQAVAGDEGATGLNSVLLQNILLPDNAPDSTVLHSLKHTLMEKNIPLNSVSSKSNPILKVTCLKEPINEFTENDNLFLGAFPDLFFLGNRFPNSGSVPTSFAQHLLKQADNRFAQVDEVVFMLFNQSQRPCCSKRSSNSCTK